MFLIGDNVEQDVDHRFSSEGSVVNDDDGDKEEVKNISAEITPNKFDKPLVKLQDMSPYDNKAFNRNLVEDRKSESADKKSEIDQIHAFMDECHEELKSMDQTLKRDEGLSVDFRNGTCPNNTRLGTVVYFDSNFWAEMLVKSQVWNFFENANNQLL
jgi:hypothetical protein